jgi:toxin ParE1/3/4
VRIRIHAEAEAEFLNSVDFYSDDSARNAEGFIREIEEELDAISLFPERYPIFEYGARAKILKRFPFSVVYRVKENEVHIVAIEHQSREPGYWRERNIK